MESPHRINVLGVGISEINYAAALDQIRAAIAERRRGYITVTGVHGVSESQEDDELRDIHNGSFLSTPDGMPMVWMGRLAGSSVISRVYGPDLMLLVLEEGVARGWRHFFYGGGDGVAEELRQKLEARIPGLTVVGTYTPPFRPLQPQEEEALAQQVAAARPDCFWVGLSTPKQERFMAAYVSKQQAGLEWAYRLFKEPKRLWKRYLKNNPLFLGRTFLQLTGLRKYPGVPGQFREW